LKEYITDNNQFLADGVTPNPGYGKTVEIDHPDAPKSPKSLSATGFQDACEAGLGGGTTGAARFGDIMLALASSADGLVLSVNQRFAKSTTFDKPKAAAALGVLVAKSIITAQDRTAILAAWPEA